MVGLVLTPHCSIGATLTHPIAAIYKTEKTSLGTFLETTRSILQVLAGHAQEIEKIIQHEFQNSVDTMPKGTRHITLLYHQVRLSTSLALFGE